MPPRTCHQVWNRSQPLRTCHQVRNRSQHTLPGLRAPVIRSETCLSILYQASMHLSSGPKPVSAYSLPPRICHRVRKRSHHTLCLHAPIIKSEITHSIFCHASTHLSSNQKPLTAYSAMPPRTCHQIRNRSQHILPCLHAPVIKSKTVHSIFCHASTHLTSSQKPLTAYCTRPPCICHQVRNCTSHQNSTHLTSNQEQPTHSIFCYASTHPTSNQKPPTA